MESNLAPIQGNVSEAVLDHLARTKGWTRFFSVILWLGAVFLILGGIMMIGMGAVGGAMAEGAAEAFGGLVGALAIGIIYLLMAFFYIYPALKLGKYSSRITELLTSPSDSLLAAALNEQRAFWKYCGIMMIIFFALYAVAIVGLIVAGVGAAAMGGMSGLDDIALPE